VFIVDTREPPVVYEIMKKMGVEVRYQKLSIGDIRGDHVLVERKHINDLYNSTVGMRIFDQFHRMMIEADERLLLPILGVHGSFNDIPVGINTNVIYGVVSSAAVRYGIHIVWVPDLEDLLRTIVGIEQKIALGRLGQPRKPRVRRLSKVDREVSVIATLLQIPVSAAKEIVRRGGVVFLLTATDKELLQIPKIGPATLKRIRKLIGYPECKCR